MGFNEVGFGSLGKARERKTDKSPEYTGSLTLKRDIRAGEKIWLSAWVKTGEDGRQFFSISSTESDQPRRPAHPTTGYGEAPRYDAQRAPRPLARGLEDTDIPF